jgi:enoyl-[acyl-carrier protein] reductase I
MLAKGKNALIVGVADHNSMAWGIAQSLLNHGIENLAFSYQHRLEKNVRSLTASIPNALLMEADVTSPSQLDALFLEIEKQWGGLDYLVHSVAAAKRDELNGPYYETSHDGYVLAQEISAFSLVELTRRAVPLMEKRGGGSILTMSYLGSERVVTNYGVMGVAKAALEASVRYLANDIGEKKIRVNALSPGPRRTISARSIPGMSGMLQQFERHSPIKGGLSNEAVGDAAIFFLSDLSRAITGEVMHVDNGFHMMGI